MATGQPPGAFFIHSVGPGSLYIVLRPKGHDWLADEIAGVKAHGIQLLVSMLTGDELAELGLSKEAECCRAAALDFLSVPIQDLGVPADTAAFTAAVLQVVTRLRQGDAVAVHCRQSVGRSGLFACAVLVASGMPLDAAVTIASRARGITVPETIDQRRWLEAHAQRLYTAAATPDEPSPPL